MKVLRQLWLPALCGLTLAGRAPGAEPPPAPLPEGTNGLAAKYPGDAGLARDPAVVFAEDFESAAAVNDLRRRWDTVFHDETLAIAADPPHVHSGRRAVAMTFPQRAGEVGNGLMKRLAPERDLLFLRYYEQFDPALDVRGARSFHNGGSLSAHYHVNGRSTPGQRADGRNKFLVSYECTAYSPAPAPGNLTAYVYHPEQRSDYGDIFYPDGLISPNTSLPGRFGAPFVPRPAVRPTLGRWHCHELMVQANVPGRRDGRIAGWLDGRLVMDFPNLRFRDIAALKLDYLTIGGYLNPNPQRTNRIWFDDVVAATAYIGPQAAVR